MANHSMQESLREAVSFLETQKYPYALIGGIANQMWGQARFTYDIDIKVLVPDLRYEAVQRRIVTAFPEPGRPDLPANPFVVSVRIGGIIADFLLAAPGYEEQIITRAKLWTIGDLNVRICTPEDLIIQKAVTDRLKDWQDIEGIIIEQNEKLDRQYIGYWLEQFSEALDNPEIMRRYQQLWNVPDNF